MSDSVLLGVCDLDGTAKTDLVSLADKLNARVVSTSEKAENICQFLLTFENGILHLQECGPAASGAVCVDFENEALEYRQRRQAPPEALLKAAGIKQGSMAHVVDATAGFGLDAFLMASAGCQVTLLERSPVLHALLENGLQRGRVSENPRVRQSVGRMTLIHADSERWLAETAAEPPEVIYLDPMFPERRKSAKVKKGMALLQKLLATEAGGEALLGVALERAQKRVVVKRPRIAQALAGRAPSFSHEGKSSRFDVYLCVRAK